MAIKRYIKDDSAIFGDGITIPANTATLSSAIEIGAGGIAGAVSVVFQAKTACALADTKKITVYIASSATSGGTYITDATFVYTASGAKTFAIGEVIAELVIPRTANQFIKASIATDDATATGTVDIFASYNAR